MTLNEDREDAQLKFPQNTLDAIFAPDRHFWTPRLLNWCTLQIHLNKLRRKHEDADAWESPLKQASEEMIVLMRQHRRLLACDWLDLKRALSLPMTVLNQEGDLHVLSCMQPPIKLTVWHRGRCADQLTRYIENHP